MILGVGGLTPKLSPQFPDAIGDFVEIDELVPTSHYSVL